MSEVFSNFGKSTLNGGINNSVTTLVVTSAVNFPTTGNFRIRVDNELMLVTGVSSDTFTVTRAQEGTTGASHSSLADVVHVITKASLEKFREESTLQGTYSGRPAAGSAGRLHFPTDSIYLGRDNGVTWDEFAPVFKVSPPPTNSSFTWRNQSTATATDTANGIFLSAPASAGPEATNMLEVTAPATPYTLTAGWIPGFTGDNYGAVGIGFIENASNKCELNMIRSDSPKHLWDVRRMTNLTTYSTDVVLLSAYPGTPLWFKIDDDGTNRHHYFSYDSINWVTLATVGRTTFITADRIGFFIWNITQFVCGTLIHWSIT